MFNAGKTNDGSIFTKIIFFVYILIIAVSIGEHKHAFARGSNSSKDTDYQWLDPVDTYTLSRNIDGDTLEVFVTRPIMLERWWRIFTIWSRLWHRPQLTIRMIGINSPESVDPHRPIECGGKEASVALHDLLDKYINRDGRSIHIVQDHTQSSRDIFGRTLGYVELISPDRTGKDAGHVLDKVIDVNFEMLRLGYAREYTFNKTYNRQRKYIAAQEQAKRLGLGIWASSTCSTMPTHVFISRSP